MANICYAMVITVGGYVVMREGKGDTKSGWGKLLGREAVMSFLGESTIPPPPPPCQLCSRKLYEVLIFCNTFLNIVYTFSKLYISFSWWNCVNIWSCSAADTKKWGIFKSFFYVLCSCRGLYEAAEGMLDNVLLLSNLFSYNEMIRASFIIFIITQTW